MTISRNLSILADGVSSTGVLNVDSGGTGLTTLTANYIPYGNGTSSLSSSANLTFDGTTLTAANNASISGLNVGKGNNAVSTNTAFGVTALNAATLSGASNTAIGYQAGLVVTSGANITAVGYQAGKAALGAQDGTFIGSTAGANVTSGGSNTAIGAGTLFQVTTGSSNTAVGLQAGASGNISNTTAVGYQANRNTGASNGAYFGYNSGLAASGTTNTFIGYNSGSAVTTGAKNVIIGAYTGTAAPISLTGSNNIVLSDGDANVRLSINSTGSFGIGSTPSYGTSGQVLTSGGSAAAPTWTTATNANTASAIVQRDASGNFSSGTISATGVTETVFAVTGATPALSPTNGTIQTWTLAGASTPTAGTWSTGSSLTLQIVASTNSVTWSSIPVTWIGGSAPTLSTSGTTIIELWKVGSTTYGALVGSA
jgi:hypothetical protein